MEKMTGGVVFSQKWCAENNKKNAWIGAISSIIAIIPTPPTMFFGTSVSIVMAGISILCAYD